MHRCQRLFSYLNLTRSSDSLHFESVLSAPNMLSSFFSRSFFITSLYDLAFSLFFTSSSNLTTSSSTRIVVCILSPYTYYVYKFIKITEDVRHHPSRNSS